MEKVPVSRLKGALAGYLALVKRGESLIVTEHGRPVAVLEPIAWDLDRDETLRALVLSGQVTPAVAELPEAFLRGPRVHDPEGRIRRSLDEERRSGW